MGLKKERIEQLEAKVVTLNEIITKAIANYKLQSETLTVIRAENSKLNMQLGVLNTRSLNNVTMDIQAETIAKLQKERDHYKKLWEESPAIVETYSLKNINGATRITDNAMEDLFEELAPDPYPGLDPKDILTTTFKPPNTTGGFSSNRTDVAIRVIHLPSKCEAVSWDDRSPHKNRVVAYKELCKKVAQWQYAKNLQEIKAKAIEDSEKKAIRVKLERYDKIMHLIGITIDGSKNFYMSTELIGDDMMGGNAAYMFEVALDRFKLL